MLESKGVTRNVFSLVANSFRALWFMRTDAHFGTGREDPSGLIDVVEGFRRRLLEECGIGQSSELHSCIIKRNCVFVLLLTGFQ